MYNASIYVSLLLIIFSSLYYVYYAWQGKTKPVPTTWILLLVTMVLTLFFAMKGSGGIKNWTEYIAIIYAVINVGIILPGVIATNIRNGTLKIAFDRFQIGCLYAAGVVVIVWYFTNQLLLSYLLIQSIALIAYIATAQRLMKVETTTEPMLYWIGAFLANLIAAYPALVKWNIYAWIYLVRAIPSVFFIIYLIWRIKNRMKYANGQIRKLS